MINFMTYLPYIVQCTNVSMAYLWKILYTGFSGFYSAITTTFNLLESKRTNQTVGDFAEVVINPNRAIYEYLFLSFFRNCQDSEDAFTGEEHP